MNRADREQWFRDLFLCGAVLAALELMVTYQFSEGSWTWDWRVRSSVAGLLALAAGLLTLGVGNGLLWKLESLTGDRNLRAYWSYCAGLMLLCMLWRDLDTSFHMVLVFVAILSTPLGLVGAALGALPDGIRYLCCYGAMLALSVAEVAYHHWLLSRHKA